MADEGRRMRKERLDEEGCNARLKYKVFEKFARHIKTIYTAALFVGRADFGAGRKRGDRPEDLPCLEGSARKDGD